LAVAFSCGVWLISWIAALNMNVVKTIFLSRAITLPAGVILSILIFFTLKGIFYIQA
jgi:PiT family inorganic phosphate transporter